ncbi:uncharacterized protein BKCO1_1000179 [Diplodia corticola]|uniref:Uncharacterized protein n=1 Tax=Diplodia corticola TaxID=236234 RepID=A0A1J9RHT0_9PEZI|nr:uncharacterized protein BKCO1_1000179 [Diplodia corticola]OJD40184.1 hypothetical protein BKCO1_1000179 [Diplodia corticola]
MSSNVGSHNIYEDGDQKNYKQSELNTGEERFHEGQVHSHKALDSKDERTIANKLAREEKRQNEPVPKDLEQVQYEKDATLPAKAHGNDPSRGAQLDQELREEDEAALKKKGHWGSKQ